MINTECYIQQTLLTSDIKISEKWIKGQTFVCSSRSAILLSNACFS